MGIIVTNLTDLVDPPKVPKSQVGQAIPFEDFRRLLEYVKDTKMELPIMLAQGVPMKVASERLGHSTINITADLYSHVTKDLNKDASKKIDGFFNEKIK